MQRLSSREFTYLKAYSIIEPFGAKRDNYHTALLATLYANTHRKKDSPPMKMEEFFYKDAQSLRDYQEAKTQQSGQKFAAWLETKGTQNG